MEMKGSEIEERGFDTRQGLIEGLIDGGVAFSVIPPSGLMLFPCLLTSSPAVMIYC